MRVRNLPDRFEELEMNGHYYYRNQGVYIYLDRSLKLPKQELIKQMDNYVSFINYRPLYVSRDSSGNMHYTFDYREDCTRSVVIDDNDVMLRPMDNIYIGDDDFIANVRKWMKCRSDYNNVILCGIGDSGVTYDISNDFKTFMQIISSNDLKD